MIADLTIGSICRIAGVTPRTVRHYEAEGILSPSIISSGGRKQYPEDTVEIIQLVQLLQECGYSLKKVKALIHRNKPGTKVPEKAAAKLRTKLTEISETLDNKIKTLKSSLNGIKGMLKRSSGCETCPGVQCSTCPMYASIKTMGILSPDNSSIKGDS